MSKLLYALASVALVAALCNQNCYQAQKTTAIKKNNNFQQQIYSSQNQINPSSGNTNSVYGGYSSSSSVNQGLVAPVQKQRFSSSSSQQTSSVAVRPTYQQESSSSYEEQSSEQLASAAEADAEPASYGSVNGQPGKDFPAYTRVPKTSFSCDGLPYEYGMYADEETSCQAYHVCYNGRKDSFLCGVGTVFNQRILHCDYWYSVDCGKSSQYYSSNAYMGSSQPEPGPAQASGPVAQSSSSYSSSKRTQINSVNTPVRVQTQQQQASSSSNQWIRNAVQQREESN